MPRTQDLNCWEITQCQETESCAARKYTDTPCWDVARQLGCYQSTESVCPDCIVYLVKSRDEEINSHELDDIVKQRCQDARPYCPLMLQHKKGRQIFDAAGV